MWLLYNTVQTTLVPTVSLPGHSWMGGIRHLLQGAVACALCTDFLRNVHVKSQSMRFWSNKCFSNPLGVQTGVSGSSDSHWSPVIAADLNSGSGQVSKCSWFSANGYFEISVMVNMPFQTIVPSPPRKHARLPHWALERGAEELRLWILAVWLRASYFCFLGLSFLIYEMGRRRIPYLMRWWWGLNEVINIRGAG